MASVSASKTPCSTCGSKGIGIFKCEGCAQTFCRKHVIEHRDVLNQQLDEIVFEYDHLQQTIGESNDKANQHPLIEQIDKWEKESIEKIRQAARRARKELNSLTSSSTGMVSKELHTLGARLRKAREDDDYVETDLQMWTSKLKQLRSNANSVISTARIGEDSTKVLVGKIHISTTTPTLISKERFGEFRGPIHIKNDGYVAVFDRSKVPSNAFVRGTVKYSTGKHQIRFRISKKVTFYHMAFGIVSAMVSLSESSEDADHQYGWKTSDDLDFSSSDRQLEKNFQDFHDKTTFDLQLTLDCDNQTISYFNERTRNTHQMKVNTSVCPLPWQLEFYLFDFSDRVELLSSTQIS